MVRPSLSTTGETLAIELRSSTPTAPAPACALPRLQQRRRATAPPGCGSGKLPTTALRLRGRALSRLPPWRSTSPAATLDGRAREGGLGVVDVVDRGYLAAVRSVCSRQMAMLAWRAMFDLCPEASSFAAWAEIAREIAHPLVMRCGRVGGSGRVPVLDDTEEAVELSARSRSPKRASGSDSHREIPHSAPFGRGA
jgi:hypothetical protein